MTTTISRPEDVINLALTKIGSKTGIVDIYDGSLASRAALSCYAQTRDQVLYQGDWDFAARSVPGALLKQAPTQPPNYVVNPWTPAFPSPPWGYEYLYPPDAVKIRAVKRTTAFVPNWDPRYNLFWIDNDSGFTPPKKVILCNVPSALILYTGQITDPQTWNTAFAELLADTLAKALGPVLMNVDAYKVAATEEAKDAAIAQSSRERS